MHRSILPHHQSSSIINNHHKSSLILIIIIIHRSPSIINNQSSIVIFIYQSPEIQSCSHDLEIERGHYVRPKSNMISDYVYPVMLLKTKKCYYCSQEQRDISFDQRTTDISFDQQSVNRNPIFCQFNQWQKHFPNYVRRLYQMLTSFRKFIHQLFSTEICLGITSVNADSFRACIDKIFGIASLTYIFSYFIWFCLLSIFISFFYSLIRLIRLFPPYLQCCFHSHHMTIQAIQE